MALGGGDNTHENYYRVRNAGQRGKHSADIDR